VNKTRRPRCPDVAQALIVPARLVSKQCGVASQNGPRFTGFESYDRHKCMRALDQFGAIEIQVEIG